MLGTSGSARRGCTLWSPTAANRRAILRFVTNRRGWKSKHVHAARRHEVVLDGIAPKTSDAEMLTLAVMQALLGFTSETHWLRYARANLRPTRKGEKPRPGQRFFKPLRQVIESINATFKLQLDFERHGGKTPAGVCARIAQRVLALTAAIWHNDTLGLTVRRSLTAYDH